MIGKKAVLGKLLSIVSQLDTLKRVTADVKTRITVGHSYQAGYMSVISLHTVELSQLSNDVLKSLYHLSMLYIMINLYPNYLYIYILVWRTEF